MLKRLYRWWKSPATSYWVELKTSEFLTDARLERSAGEDDYSHILVMDFSEPVRDGNDVSHINLRGESGRTLQSYDLITGDTSDAIPFNPSPMTIDVVSVDRDHNVYATDTIQVVAEPGTEF